jgi:hypothetical protein
VADCGARKTLKANSHGQETGGSQRTDSACDGLHPTRRRTTSSWRRVRPGLRERVEIQNAGRGQTNEHDKGDKPLTPGVRISADEFTLRHLAA